MSIRLKFTLLYNAILAITLAIFGFSLYSIQANSTLNALKSDIIRSSETLGQSVLRTATESSKNSGQQPKPEPPNNLPPPKPFSTFSSDQAFQRLPEREIVRVLDSAGNLVASPYGRKEDALPFSGMALDKLVAQKDSWEPGTVQGQQMLIYNRPIIKDGETRYILQVARPLTEREHSLQTLANTLVIASLLTLVAAFGIGWVFFGITLKPIKRITKTAGEIGKDRDFSQRVYYSGPKDEVGELATTFNGMLTRLQDAYQQVEHSLSQQRDFVADVSHELRTPLTTLRGNLGLLARTPSLPADEQKDIVNDMVGESDRMIRLVNEILKLAHADGGRKLKSEILHLAPIVEDVSRQIQVVDRDRMISVSIPSDLKILGDSDAFKQIFMILLDNAEKHSSGDIQVEATGQANRILVKIIDHGIGIAPDMLPHIFDRFFKAGENTESTGFGLGLPIAKALVEGLGGTIEIESLVDIGSTVTLQFPAVESKEVRG